MRKLFVVFLFCLFILKAGAQGAERILDRGLVFSSRACFIHYYDWVFNAGAGYRWKQHALIIGAGYYIGNADGPKPQMRLIRYEYSPPFQWGRLSGTGYLECQDYGYEYHNLSLMWIGGYGLRLRIAGNFSIEQTFGVAYYRSWSYFRQPWLLIASGGLRYALDFHRKR